MSQKFRDKYRTSSARLASWDYGWNAAYFVTICTKNGKCFFGGIIDGIINLSEIGKIATTCWQEIPEHFPFVKLCEYVIMPNHIHGILIIDKPDDLRYQNKIESGAHAVETQDFASLRLRNTKQKPKNKFGPQSKNLASVIRGFKIGVTKNARKICSDFQWQPRYYDHIIRDEYSFHQISVYIRNNPRNWKTDELHSEK